MQHLAHQTATMPASRDECRKCGQRNRFVQVCCSKTKGPHFNSIQHHPADKVHSMEISGPRFICQKLSWHQGLRKSLHMAFLSLPLQLFLWDSDLA